MLISTDGGCKRQGTPQCSALGVAWVQTENGQMYFKSRYENSESTSQRGELMGLICALEEARRAPADETIVIVTDSEYLYNSVMLGWYEKWYENNWIGATGPVKNRDLWQQIYYLIKECLEWDPDEQRVILQWTKGHLMTYTKSNVKKCMRDDPTGVELFMRVTAMAKRPSEEDRIIDDFLYNLNKHDHIAPPREICLERVIANVVADCLADYLVTTLDDVVL